MHYHVSYSDSMTNDSRVAVCVVQHNSSLKLCDRYITATYSVCGCWGVAVRWLSVLCAVSTALLT